MSTDDDQGTSEGGGRLPVFLGSYKRSSSEAAVIHRDMPHQVAY